MKTVLVPPRHFPPAIMWSPALGVTAPTPQQVLKRKERLLYLDNFCLEEELVPEDLEMSGPCFRHFGFDDRCQSVDIFEVFLVETRLHQLDAEMPLDLQNQLQYVDGIDFQFSAKQRLIVAQILRGQVSDPQAVQYEGLELLLNTRHDV
jgi:hypothetical protein